MGRLLPDERKVSCFPHLPRSSQKYCRKRQYFSVGCRSKHKALCVPHLACSSLKYCRKRQYFSASCRPKSPRTPAKTFKLFPAAPIPEPAHRLGAGFSCGAIPAAPAGSKADVRAFASLREGGGAGGDGRSARPERYEATLLRKLSQWGLSA